MIKKNYINKNYFSRQASISFLIRHYTFLDLSLHYYSLLSNLFVSARFYCNWTSICLECLPFPTAQNPIACDPELLVACGFWLAVCSRLTHVAAMSAVNFWPRINQNAGRFGPRRIALFPPSCNPEIQSRRPGLRSDRLYFTIKMISLVGIGNERVIFNVCFIRWMWLELRLSLFKNPCCFVGSGAKMSAHFLR